MTEVVIENAFCWMESVFGAKRLITPRADGRRYERPADLLFPSVAAAEAWLDEEIDDYAYDEKEIEYLKSWLLCYRTVVPVPMAERGPMHEWMTIKQICTILSITDRTFEKWRARGIAPEMVRLPSGRPRCRRDIFEAWLEALPVAEAKA